MTLKPDDLGCTAEQHQCLRQVGADMRKNGIPNSRTPIVAFYHQTINAERRGIDWEMSAWEWWTIWQESGHWEQRGTRHNEYVMCRKGDVGPYAVGNVFIATCADNCSNKKTKTSGLPRGVKKIAKGRMPYAAQRYIDGKQRYLGVFPTPELAHAAYLEAAA